MTPTTVVPSLSVRWTPSRPPARQVRKTQIHSLPVQPTRRIASHHVLLCLRMSVRRMPSCWTCVHIPLNSLTLTRQTVLSSRTIQQRHQPTRPRIPQQTLRRTRLPTHPPIPPLTHQRTLPPLFSSRAARP